MRGFQYEVGKEYQEYSADFAPTGFTLVKTL